MFPVVFTFSTEEGRTLCTLQHHLHAPGWTVIGGGDREGGIQAGETGGVMQAGVMDHA